MQVVQSIAAFTCDLSRNCSAVTKVAAAAGMQGSMAWQHATIPLCRLYNSTERQNCRRSVKDTASELNIKTAVCAVSAAPASKMRRDCKLPMRYTAQRSRRFAAAPSTCITPDTANHNAQSPAKAPTCAAACTHSGCCCCCQALHRAPINMHMRNTARCDRLTQYQSSGEARCSCKNTDCKQGRQVIVVQKAQHQTYSRSQQVMLHSASQRGWQTQNCTSLHAQVKESRRRVNRNAQT